MVLAEVMDAYRNGQSEEVRKKYKMVYGNRSLGKKIIVLDDDPTGVQTVHDVRVYTSWNYECIKDGFEEEKNLFFILTNSRSFSREKTIEVHKTIGENIIKASRETGREFVVISRSDSTLRGHYPLETEVLRETLREWSGEDFDGEIIAPFFPEGGRYTIGNIHYVKQGEELIPAGETEFARDKTFGYTSSDLREWIAEKTNGKYQTAISISLEDLREADIDKVTKKLLQAENFGKIIVNAVSYEDLEVFALAFAEASRKKRYLLRTAAGMVKAIGGMGEKPLLRKEDLKDGTNPNGGLIIVGSHVNKTTRQLEKLKELEEVSFIEFNQHLVLESERFYEEIKRVESETADILKTGKTVGIFTRRERLDIKGGDQETQLRISVEISSALTRIVQNLKERPSFIIAKGGITSSDIGVVGLGVKRAKVMGQIKPGIPVWKIGGESKFPGIPYIIFPGNVGGDDTLKEIVEELIRR